MEHEEETLVPYCFRCHHRIADRFARQAVSQAEDERRKQVLMLTRIGYCEDLMIPCDPADVGCSEAVKNFTIDNENELNVRIQYGNFITGRNVTLKQIIDSCTAFVNGDREGCRLMEEFHVFRHADMYEQAERSMTEDEFRRSIRAVLKEMHGADAEIAGSGKEQLDAAVTEIRRQKTGGPDDSQETRQ